VNGVVVSVVGEVRIKVGLKIYEFTLTFHILCMQLLFRLNCVEQQPKRLSQQHRPSIAALTMTPHTVSLRKQANQLSLIRPAKTFT